MLNIYSLVKCFVWGKKSEYHTKLITVIYMKNTKLTGLAQTLFKFNCLLKLT